jgi:hypothetical protein
MQLMSVAQYPGMDGALSVVPKHLQHGNTTPENSSTPPLISSSPSDELSGVPYSAATAAEFMTAMKGRAAVPQDGAAAGAEETPSAFAAGFAAAMAMVEQQMQAFMMKALQQHKQQPGIEGSSSRGNAEGNASGSNTNDNYGGSQNTNAPQHSTNTNDNNGSTRGHENKKDHVNISNTQSQEGIPPAGHGSKDGGDVNNTPQFCVALAN